ncbi:electron transfer flavoprotein subunit alpha/FixB family protein [Candidatus Vallotia lariciata]|uniref:electron transfer flavoprotein subunit alpha/FixB family protein n=1 Tax=Candidatus Vallotia laricis TaxID=2018052 RepID=UPI001D00DBB4|nr:electron transfer flavoprotein subunit alpha/FixB family protein [Candidatus Vallotia lariciata]
MTILVIAEHDNIALKAITLNTVAAAQKLGGEVHVLVAGYRAGAVAATVANIAGVAKTLLADAPQLCEGLAENIEATVLSIARQYTHIVLPATTYGKNIAPRLAAKLDVAQISDITAIIRTDIFERPIYAGNAIATVQSVDSIKVITIRGTAFNPVSADGGSTPIQVIKAAAAVPSVSFVSRNLRKLNRPELTSARVIVSGGRGLGSKKNYAHMLGPLADKLGAALGASRAAVEEGYAPNDYQIGQSGKIVAPQLYIAIGISGAIQHVAGMKDSKVIVAINKDPEAPIFDVADYGLVGDLFMLIPELVNALHVYQKK